VKISYQAARAVDRYLRVRVRHAQAYLPQLWLGINNRSPLTRAGIYQAVARSAGSLYIRSGSGIISPIPGSTAAEPRAT